MSSTVATIARKLSMASGQLWTKLTKQSFSQGLRSLTVWQRVVLASLSVAIVAIAYQFATPFVVHDQGCHVHVAQSQDRRPPAPYLPHGPAVFLKRAQQAQGFEMGQPWKPEAEEHLIQCSEWKPVLESILPPLSEARAQLMCRNALLSPSWLEEGNDVATPSSEALISHVGANLGSVNGIVRQCQAMQGELRKMRGQAVTSSQRSRSELSPVAMLDRVATLEVPVREALQTLHRLSAVLSNDSSDVLNAELGTATSLRVALRVCLVDTVREARLVADKLPRNRKATALHSRVCNSAPAKLADLERFSILEANAESDAGVVFGGGLLLSHAAMSSKDVPMFDDSVSDLDIGLNLAAVDDADIGSETSVPRTLLMAEALLLRGFEASEGEAERVKKASSRAGVLAYHAKFLMELGEGWEKAAELRYRAASTLARQHGRDKLAAHSLAQLGYFLSLRGLSEEALVAAEEAASIEADDPLATYLRATLRLSTGAVRTDEAALAVKSDLEAVKGRLPNPSTEADLMTSLTVLEKWFPVARSETLGVCFSLGDVAEILACLAAKLVYA
eukprot:TRINITY_DN8763_c0_g2_i1.p1 TRINITY_DN8763_c0_g2~~TRINITY_DN8763_c0_g2_i1.p1  ORF type:complete len:563 (-),score=111.51 TRINITY_DN8763_c0_g2_i1:54-1742(-)